MRTGRLPRPLATRVTGNPEHGPRHATSPPKVGPLTQSSRLQRVGDRGFEALAGGRVRAEGPGCSRLGLTLRCRDEAGRLGAEAEPYARP
jgi:hypothetical protein